MLGPGWIRSRSKSKSKSKRRGAGWHLSLGLLSLDFSPFSPPRLVQPGKWLGRTTDPSHRFRLGSRVSGSGHQCSGHRQGP